MGEMINALNRKGIYEPFKFWEENDGIKARGWNTQNRRFYFNDIPEENYMAALGKLITMIWGRK